MAAEPELTYPFLMRYTVALGEGCGRWESWGQESSSRTVLGLAPGEVAQDGAGEDSPPAVPGQTDPGRPQVRSHTGTGQDT